MENKELYEKIKEQILGETVGMRQANQMVPVKGERMDISFPDRTVNIIYYKAKVENAPLFICFHGGGFLFGGNALDDGQWDFMRENLGVNVVSVEYRKSPDFKWKDALDDAYDVACYLNSHAMEYGFNPEKIYSYGASAGANLATTLCLYAKEKGGVKFYKQILMYPFLDCATNPDEKGEGSLSGPIMHIFNDMHCEPYEAKNPLISPVFATREELQGMPESILIMADNDNLKHEGYTYARNLAEAGIQTHVTSNPGMPHGFVENAFTDPDSELLAFMSPEDRELLKSGDMKAEMEKAYVFVKKYM